MNHAAKCKFCGRQLVLRIDDDYGALGDPFKLLAFAACNQCANLRERRRLLETSIHRLCLGIRLLPQKDRQLERSQLETLTRKYAVLVADWHNMSGFLWDEEFVNLLLEKPDRSWDILANYWKTFRATQKKGNCA